MVAVGYGQTGEVGAADAGKSPFQPTIRTHLEVAEDETANGSQSDPEVGVVSESHVTENNLRAIGHVNFFILSILDSCVDVVNARTR